MLASSLHNLGVQWLHSGRREEALAPLSEALTPYWALAPMNPGTYLPRITGSLYLLVHALSSLEKSEETRVVLEEAFDRLGPDIERLPRRVHRTPCTSGTAWRRSVGLNRGEPTRDPVEAIVQIVLLYRPGVQWGHPPHLSACGARSKVGG